jgi:hypothetical protein
MANIIEYNGPQNPEINPSEVGERSIYNEARLTRQEGEQAGARIKGGVDTLAGAVEKIAKQYQHTDVTNTLSQFATANNQLHDASTAFLKDPNLDISDPDLGAKFMDTVYNPAMQKIKDGVKSQAGMDAFNEHYNEFSVHFKQQFQRDLSAMAGIHADAAINNYVTQQSQLASQNPSALKPIMATWDSTVKSMIASSPNISPEDSEKIQDKFSQLGKNKIQESALGSLMLKNPGAAKAALDAGEFPDVNGLQANMAIKQMDTMARQNAAADRANQRFAEEEHNDNMMRNTVSQIGALSKQAQTGDPVALQKLRDMGTQILIDGPKNGMKGTTAYQAHEMIHNTLSNLTQKTDTLTDASTLADIHTKMLDPNGPQVTAADIVKENISGKLSDADTHEAVSLLNTMKSDPSTQTYMQQFKEATTDFESVIKGAQSMTAEVPGLGGYRYKEFMNDHLKSFQQGLTAGLSAKEMLDPAGKNYIFKDLNDYMTSPMQEQTVFGKQFTLSDGLAPAVPSSVRVMEAYRQQTQAAKATKDRMDKLTGTKIEDRTGGPPMPNPVPGGGL